MEGVPGGKMGALVEARRRIVADRQVELAGDGAGPQGCALRPESQDGVVVVARRGIALVEGQEQRRRGLGRQGREASRQRSVGGFGPGPIGLGDVAAEIGQRRHLG